MCVFVCVRARARACARACMQKLCTKNTNGKGRHTGVFRSLSRPVQNRRLKAAKTRPRMLPSCAQQSMSMTSWTRPVCGKNINYDCQKPDFICSSLVMTEPRWLRLEELTSHLFSSVRFSFIQLPGVHSLDRTLIYAWCSAPNDGTVSRNSVSDLEGTPILPWRGNKNNNNN